MAPGPCQIPVSPLLLAPATAQTLPSMSWPLPLEDTYPVSASRCPHPMFPILLST